MSPRPDNIEITGTDLPARLTRLREARRLTKSELARLAQVSYRTVHELESGRRNRIQEKTLVLLAGALGVEPEELTHQGTAPSSPAPGARSDPVSHPARRYVQSPWVPVCVLLLGLAIGALAVWRAGADGAIWTVTDGTLSARHAVFGHELWRYPGPGTVTFGEVSPWSNRVLLALTRNHAADASPLVAIDRRSGRVLWTVVPDLQEMRDAFGPEIMDAGSMSPARLVVADLFADHEPVLVVLFHHSLYYPASLCVVDARGRSLAQYANKGHIFEMLVADLDRDGTSELVVLGTNNDPAYQGATIIILDEFHFRGASTDAVATPASTVPDSARIRLILPQFEARFMELLDLDRLNARNARLMPREDGTTGLSVEIGHVRDRSRLIVFLDAQLNPLGTDINDDLKLRIRRTWPDSLQLAGPGDPRWRRNWLASHVRFEAGHWPPGDASQDLRPPVDDLTVSGDRPVPPSP